MLLKFCRVPEGPSFSQREIFKCVITGTSKGFIGNKRGDDRVTMKNLIPGFDIEGGSCCQIKYQSYGRTELYSNSQLSESTYSRPSYFSTGECLTNIADQNRLVGDLLGESTNLPGDTAERRQCNYIRFMKQERDDR